MQKYHRQVPWQTLTPFPIKGLEKKQQEQKKTVRFAGGLLNIEFPYNEETVNKIKTIPGRRFDKVNKRWVAPASYEAMEFLQEIGFEFDKVLQEKWEEIDSGLGSAKAKETTVDLSRLKHKPYPFQEKGIAFIEGKKGRALVGDDMGLGKTIQAIGYASMHPEFRRIVVVCTASSKYNWQREIEKWTGEKAVILGGILAPNMAIEFDNRWLIINYDVLGLKSSEATRKEIDEVSGKRKWMPKGTWAGYLTQIKADLILLDETQKIKNDKAIRSKATLYMCKNASKVIGLTGTPIKNRPIEIFTLIKAINPHIFPSKRSFGEKFCGLTHNGWGWVYDGATNLDELHRILCNTIMIRRKKDEVLPELPKKVRTVIPVDITNRKEYDRQRMI
jgi:SWI/SNF-related matrix-associated actin-dependent regulator 1 of chromatin subfamily A